MRLLKEQTIIDNAQTLTDLVKNSQFFSFKGRKSLIIAASNLGHAMTIAKALNLGPCIIQTLDQKDGCTLYVQQYLETKKRIVA